MDMNAVKTALDQLGRTFEEFKSKNDERIKQIETKGSADVITVDQVKKINDSLGELEGLKKSLEKLEKAAARKGLGAGGDVTQEQDEHRKGWHKFARKGHEEGLTALEQKAFNITTPADGGYLVPEEVNRNIDAKVIDLSPMRNHAEVIQIGTSDYKRPYNLRGTASGWVGETDARTATNTNTFAEWAPTMGEIYANPAATQQSLDDVFFDLEAHIADQVATEFAYQEGVAFATGDGTNKPTGFLTSAVSWLSDATRPYGQLQIIPTGVAAGFPAFANSSTVQQLPSDVLLTCWASLKAPYRQNARWWMNKSTVAAARAWKDGEGNYIWRPGLVDGVPSMLLGHPYEEDENMPSIGAGAKCIAFGDFKRGYIIVDRFGVRSLRDPYTNKPYVMFYTTKRLGGKVYNSEAIKVIRCTTSTTST